MAIPFTQYLRPDGRKRATEIERPPWIETMADRFIASGGCYECEHLMTGHASLTAVKYGRDVCIEVVENGPEVPAAVDRLVQHSMGYLDDGDPNPEC